MGANEHERRQERMDVTKHRCTAGTDIHMWAGMNGFKQGLVGVNVDETPYRLYA